MSFIVTHGTEGLLSAERLGNRATLTEEEHMECMKFAIDRRKDRFRSLPELVLIVHGQPSRCQERRPRVARMACYL